LAPDELRKLREIVGAIRSRRRVIGDWEFGRKLSRGRGVCALFAGPPGTGKTMAAEVIAHELGLDLYIVDLSTIVSKYVGETEKNLAKVLDAGETSHGLLVVNECDALLGKRTEIRDAHDKFANIEVAYLLQRIESYAGLAVLTTNFRTNIDEAFLRRLDFLIDFRFPDVAERLHIWRVTIPAAAPLADDIDWRYLAETFAIAGGNIRSAIIHAAYQAAAGDRPIGLADLVLGVRRELEKLGRAPGASDFGRYAHLIDGTRE
jgi:SpoVK/Ycf46/Vps4 family AAA+-type ATPase